MTTIFLESVQEHQAGLQSFRSMRRIEARRKNASPLRLRFSQSFASLRQRLSQAMVRSTIQRLGSTANPLIGSLDDFGVEVGQDFREGVVELRPLVGSVGEQLFQERVHPEQRREKHNAAVAI